jgi:hypothetical protein
MWMADCASFRFCCVTCGWETHHGGRDGKGAGTVWRGFGRSYVPTKYIPIDSPCYAVNPDIILCFPRARGRLFIRRNHRCRIASSSAHRLGRYLQHVEKKNEAVVVESG